jgi:WXG100 family type VII secretion target
MAGYSAGSDGKGGTIYVNHLDMASCVSTFNNIADALDKAYNQLIGAYQKLDPSWMGRAQTSFYQVYLKLSTGMQPAGQNLRNIASNLAGTDEAYVSVDNAAAKQFKTPHNTRTHRWQH